MSRRDPNVLWSACLSAGLLALLLLMVSCLIAMMVMRGELP